MEKKQFIDIKKKSTDLKKSQKFKRPSSHEVLSDIIGFPKKTLEKLSAFDRLFKGKHLIGLVEPVVLIGSKGRVKAKALFDTGATRSSVDMGLAAKAGLGPIVDTVQVKSKTMLTGSVRRPVVLAKVKIKKKKYKALMTVADRSNMSFPILIGRDVIHSNFVLDVEKTHKSYEVKDVKSKKERQEYMDIDIESEREEEIK